ncbi:MAG: ribonuclease [Allosphingosinicella sp.]|uniref:ribonuclease n=1 Tax=Allosphingosinicella sp. TaxID=2823234 RepID=UPI0039461871
MAEWLYEEGIGERRAILVEGGEIVEAAIELPGTLRAGAVLKGRLTAILIPGRRGIVALDGGGGEALIEPLPPGVTEGAMLHVEIVREAPVEPGRAKLPKCRAADGPPRPGPTLAERLAPVARHPAAGPDRFEEAGWSELIEEAMRGEIAFPGGALRMSLTPAMTLFDVDGGLAPAELAVAGAAAAARAVRRFGIGGSIGIDLPTLAAKAERQAAAAAFDAALPPPFERTAVNGFGFLQVVRRRARASIPEIVRADPAAAAARALLRRAERTAGAGPRELVAAPAVVAVLERQPDWTAELARRVGAGIGLRADPALPIWSGHVQSRFA